MRRPYKNTQTYKQTKHKLKSLYLEYKRLNKQINKTTEDNHRLDKLITEMSILEYKFIIQLKQRLIQ